MQTLTAYAAELHAAMKILGPHFGEIAVAWRKRLRKLGATEEEVKGLSRSTLAEVVGYVRSGDFDGCFSMLEQEGKTLQGRGISPVLVAGSVALYLESSLPHLLRSESSEQKMILALSHLAAVGQLFLLSGYFGQWAENWHLLAEKERYRFSQELHDDVGHNLLVLKLYMEMAAMDLKRGDVGQLSKKVEEALAVVSDSLHAMRRLILDMGPAALSQFGFVPALKLYIRQFSQIFEIQVSLQEADLPENLFPAYETAVYRVLQGALSNVARHSQAKHVNVALGKMGGSVLVMTIEDDGVGFEIKSKGAARSFGLRSMRERIETLGGRFYIESWPRRAGHRKHGTRIEIDLPLTQQP
ncbi:MAG: sensor histidine kinase [Acidobacteria bacterium]|nr:sensor histidine kinase [Acidobacteriota bacterium]